MNSVIGNFLMSALMNEDINELGFSKEYYEFFRKENG